MITKAVFSFWSKPYLNGENIRSYGGFNDSVSFNYSWILSVNCAIKHFKEVELITDTKGYEILKKLNLPFTNVVIELDRLENINENLWAIGKLYSYSIQDKPFVHIDYDFYLWDNLDDISNHDIICQEIEQDFYLYNGILERYLNKVDCLDTTIGKYLFKYGSNVFALNCGIFGGYNIPMIKKYSETALKIGYEMNNLLITNTDFHIDFADSLFPEQHFLGMFCKVNNLSIYSVRNNKKITHLISTAKKNEYAIEKLKKRVINDYPEYLSYIETYESI